MSNHGRNEQCPCGSGLKYKRCCLRRQDAVALDAARGERVWDRMQSWTWEHFGDELGEALKEHMDARGIGTDERPAMDDDVGVAMAWLLIDRRLAGAEDTPARHYADRPELPDSERSMAMRIAGSGLGIHRVRDCEPGAWIDLEDVLSGARVRVASPNVSRETVRWQVLVCRVMTGGPVPSLWGGAAFYQPTEETELVAELEGIARTRGLGTSPAGLEAAWREGAGEMACFIPASRRIEPVPYTTEGDMVAICEAWWSTPDPDRALHELLLAPELTGIGDTEEGGGTSFQWLASRRDLLARRMPMPAGAICIESRPMSFGDDGEPQLGDAVSLGSFVLRGRRLEFSGISEARMGAALTLVERRLGDLVSHPSCRVRSIQDVTSDTPAGPPGSSSHPAGEPGDTEQPPVTDQQVLELLYRRWMDDPIPLLDGLSPREAAARGGYQDQIEGLLRSLEYRNARDRVDRRPGPEVTWLRSELHQDLHRLAG